MGNPASDGFSVMVVSSGRGEEERQRRQEEEWHDCSEFLSPAPGDDFSDLELLQFLRLQGSDKSGSRILRIVGKYFPAPVVSTERLKKYVFHKMQCEPPKRPFCIVYMHTTVLKQDNCPGITILRWIYEELNTETKDRLQVVYFIHPGIGFSLLPLDDSLFREGWLIYPTP
ncbi:hypothetical protein CRG98_046999 [Punica granatum]|uniref:CRAL-TRIO domain-containing protein n=1 Tax=Punica granatum TaxID=22663 RepID=A0A2I0HLJ7_PUNGR|nr:hypothetical protein CRG98_046999 [Punica granatum]